MKIDSAFIEKVKAGINLVEVVGSHVLLKKTGANYVGLCPFHQERSPSFSVSEQKQLFHCYGCKKGGDVIKFVMEIHGTSFTEAIEELAEKARIQIPKAFGLDEALTPEQRKQIEEKKERTQLQYKLNRFVAKFYHDHLVIDQHAKEYLEKRGITEETQKLFYLGSTPAGWSPLSRKLTEAKAPLPLANSMGLIRDSKQPGPSGINTFDLFRNRVMFPILDVRGKVVGFGGRTLPPKVQPTETDRDTDKGPKYLNSTESPLFQKSKILYGLYHSQKSIRAEDAVIIVEGYFDYLSLYQAGFKNVVATCGTALSQEHLKVLRRIASKIILLFDSDHAGETATLKSMELGLSLGMVLYGAELPKGKDVDEVLFENGSALENLETGKKSVAKILENSAPLIDREIQTLTKLASKNLEAKSSAIKQIGEWLKLFQDPIGRAIRIEKVCQDFGISESILSRAVSAEQNRPQNNFNEKGLKFSPPRHENAHPLAREPLKMIKKEVKNRPTIAMLDRKILKGLLLKGEYLEMFVESKAYLPEGLGLVDLVQHSDIRLIVSQIIQGESLTEDFQSEIQDEEVRALFREALMSEPHVRTTSTAHSTTKNEKEIPFPIKDFQVIVRKALKEVWARFSHKLLNEMLPEMNADQNFSKSQEWLDVQLKIKELDNFNDQNE